MKTITITITKNSRKTMVKVLRVIILTPTVPYPEQLFFQGKINSVISKWTRTAKKSKEKIISLRVCTIIRLSKHQMPLLMLLSQKVILNG